jgi:hypothetical protein
MTNKIPLKYHPPFLGCHSPHKLTKSLQATDARSLLPAIFQSQNHERCRRSKSRSEVTLTREASSSAAIYVAEAAG